jgi:hypothetical protein
MNENNPQTKETLLKEIDTLISYGRSDPSIKRDLLAYLSIDDLMNIKAKLLEKVNVLTEEDKAWLEQFKKYE